MKQFLLFIVICTNIYFAQQASQYFPSNVGYQWYFKETPLDSLDNPIDSLSFYRIDTFAVETVFNNKNAKLVLSKTGPFETILFQPFIDTSYISLSGTIGATYFRLPSLSNLLGDIDTTNLGGILAGVANLLNTLKSFEKWYDTYRFAQTVNSEYLVFRYDTLVTLDSMDLNLRFEQRLKRLNDEIIFTEFGTFTCKKFQQSFVISYVNQILPPPFPPIILTLVNQTESVFFAPDLWMVKREAMTNNIDLTLLGLGKFRVPGYTIVIIPPIVYSDVKENYFANEFQLYQNYPNPFNPSTTISFNLDSESFVTLNIYNLIGEKIQTLINENLSSGYHSISFNANKLAAGLYFYELKTNNHSTRKKMILLK